MTTIRPGILEKNINLDYGILVQYRQPFIYTGQPVTLYWTRWSIQWISSLRILFSLLVGF